MERGVRAGVVASAVIGLLCLTLPVSATQTLESPNYRFDEASLGTGGYSQGSSTNFRIDSATGDTAVGRSSSTNFQTEAGSRTSPDPNLTVKVNTSAANFGAFSASAAATATSTFSITNYTSYGYVAQMIGDAPKNGNYEIDAMSANATSQPGVEQFGINLVANTSPVSFGANPDNGTAPNDFGFGEVSPNYSTPNQFRFVSGETVALAPKSSGKTDYTVSYLINVSALTPGGRYTSNQTLIVTGTY